MDDEELRVPRKALDLNCVSLNQVVEEIYKLLGLIQAFKTQSENYYLGIYRDIYCGFGLWRLAMARIIALECPSTMKTRFEFMEVPRLSPMAAETKNGMDTKLIEEIEKVLNGAIIAIEENKNSFKSNQGIFFARNGLIIDLIECKITFLAIDGIEMSTSFYSGKQVYNLLKVLVENKGKIVSHEEVVDACFPMYTAGDKNLKSMEIFKMLDEKLKKIGIEEEIRPSFILTNQGYQLVI